MFYMNHNKFGYLKNYYKLKTKNAGIETYNDFIDSKRTDQDGLSGSSKQLRGLYPDHSTYTNFSIYNLHHLNLGRLKAEGGIRFNFYNLRVL